MLDDRLTPFLIEANSNPCIEVDGLVLGRVIPALLENVVRVAIDPVFPPPYSESAKNRYQCSGLFEGNKMALVYDSFLEEGEGAEKERDGENNEDENEDVEGEIEE
jgi:tubulin monoglycylase TTLL3/8